MNTLQKKLFVDNCMSFDYYMRKANGYGKDMIDTDAVIRDAMILNWLPVIENSFKMVLKEYNT